MIPTAGLLHPGDPERAYIHAFELAYQDVGYAKDAPAVMAAIIAAGLDSALTPREAIEVGLKIDPFSFGEDRIVVSTIRRLIDLADSSMSDREAVIRVSKAVQDLHRYDAIDVLGTPVAVCYRADGDPRRAVLMAVNHRDLDDSGAFVRYRDIDCTGSICGAIAGALSPGGIHDFPEEWVSAAIAANRSVYGLEIEKTAQRLYDVVVLAAEKAL
jgi:ADP-ribosylglycohydrolase